MINHIHESGSLVMLAEEERYDLRVELSRYPSTRVTIYGTPTQMDALSDYPEMEEVSLRKSAVEDLGCLRGLARLRRLEVAFGPLARVDLGFCQGTLESLALSRLRHLKDLSALPALPKLDYLELSHLHGFTPPDFRAFPNLRQLSIWNTEWPSLGWLEHVPRLETLHLSQAKVEDQDWRPILKLKHLRHLHGMRDVFKSAAVKEFLRLRPEVRVDKGIPADLEAHPEIREYLESLSKPRGS